MLYIKREINESIDEYVMDEDNTLDLIERVLGNEFRLDVENKITQKEEITDLKRIIVEWEDDCDSLNESLDEKSNELINCQNYINELEEKLKDIEYVVKC